MAVEGRADSTKKKREVLERIYIAWLKNPHLRLGQLIENSLKMGESIYYVEDDKIVSAVEGYSNDRHSNDRTNR